MKANTTIILENKSNAQKKIIIQGDINQLVCTMNDRYPEMKAYHRHTYRLALNMDEKLFLKVGFNNIDDPYKKEKMVNAYYETCKHFGYELFYTELPYSKAKDFCHKRYINNKLDFEEYCVDLKFNVKNVAAGAKNIKYKLEDVDNYNGPKF